MGHDIIPKRYLVFKNEAEIREAIEKLHIIEDQLIGSMRDDDGNVVMANFFKMNSRTHERIRVASELEFVTFNGLIVVKDHATTIDNVPVVEDDSLEDGEITFETAPPEEAREIRIKLLSDLEKEQKKITPSNYDPSMEDQPVRMVRVTNSLEHTAKAIRRGTRNGLQ